jgi:DHA1 family multidrug resistance protein-like MFS transporter
MQSLGGVFVESKVKVVLIGSAAFLYWIALYLYAPTLSIYAQLKSNNLQLIGIALSMYGLGHIIVRLPVGIIAGWLGQYKPLIIIGLILVGIGALIMGGAKNIEQLAFGRAITGVAAGTWVPLVLGFCALFPVEDGVKVTAIFTSIASVARLSATSSTGVLNDLGGYSFPFFLAACMAVLAILFILPFRETRRIPRKIAAADIVRVISRHDVLLPALLSALAQHVDWAVTFSFLPILAKNVGATNIGISIVLGGYFMMFILGNLTATATVKRYKPIILVISSFILLSMGIGASAVFIPIAGLFLAQSCVGLAQGICHPVLMGMSIQYVAGSDRDTAMGLHQNLYAVGMFTGPWLGGLLANSLGIRAMIGLTAIFFLPVSLIISRRLALASHKMDS